MLATAPSAGVVLMSEDEAERCVREINKSMEHARTLLLELYEREGWRALGYRNWRECVKVRFQHSQATLYRQLTAAQVERDVISHYEKRGPLPEAHLRPLAVINTPEERREVWNEIIESAPGSGITERHVRVVVTKHQEREGEARQPRRVAERATVPACTSCAAYTNPDNWFVTDAGKWVWAGSDAPPHLRAVSA